MVKEWHSSITDFDDILEFQEHFRSVHRQKIPKKEKRFPGSIHVSGRAYPVLKKKVLKERERRRNVLLSVATSFFTGHVAGGIAGQIGGMLWGGWEDRKDEVKKAAKVIASTYYEILNDSGQAMTLGYVFDDDNLDGAIPETY